MTGRIHNRIFIGLISGILICSFIYVIYMINFRNNTPDEMMVSEYLHSKRIQWKNHFKIKTYLKPEEWEQIDVNFNKKDYIQGMAGRAGYIWVTIPISKRNKIKILEFITAHEFAHQIVKSNNLSLPSSGSHENHMDLIAYKLTGVIPSLDYFPKKWRITHGKPKDRINFILKHKEHEVFKNLLKSPSL